jgi:hypothetical protein
MRKQFHDSDDNMHGMIARSDAAAHSAALLPSPKPRRLRLFSYLHSSISQQPAQHLQGLHGSYCEFLR